MFQYARYSFCLFSVPRTVRHVGKFTRFKRLPETFVAVETETEAFPNVYTHVGLWQDDSKDEKYEFERRGLAGVGRAWTAVPYSLSRPWTVFSKFGIVLRDDDIISNNDQVMSFIIHKRVTTR